MQELTPAIRQMQLADLPTVLKIQAASYRTLPPESLACYAAKLRASHNSCFIGELDGEIAGYLVSHPWASTLPPAFDAPTCDIPLQADCLYLHDLAVLPAWRKYGIGGRLVQCFFRTCQQTRQTLVCLVAVEGAHAYWQRHGFSAIRPSLALRQKLVGYGEQARFMHKQLSDRPPA